jgi:hypothetical protein
MNPFLHYVENPSGITYIHVNDEEPTQIFRIRREPGARIIFVYQEAAESSSRPGPRPGTSNAPIDLTIQLAGDSPEKPLDLTGDGMGDQVGKPILIDDDETPGKDKVAGNKKRET